MTRPDQSPPPRKKVLLIGVDQGNRGAGGTVRTMAIKSVLDDRYDVTLALIRPSHVDVDHRFEPLLRVFYNIRRFLSLTPPYMPQRKDREKIDKLLSQNDYFAVVVRYLATYYAIGAPNPRNLVIDLDDEPMSHYRSSSNPENPSIPHQRAVDRVVGMIRDRLHDAGQMAHSFWLSNTRDLEKVPGAICVPNLSLQAGRLPDRAPEQDSFLFVGSMRYHPNIRGLETYRDRIFPILKSRGYTPRLRVVGEHLAGMGADPSFAACNITFEGYVDDLQAAYRTAMAAISPVEHGGGTSIKVIECMTLGVPIVASEFSLRGYAEAISSAIPEAVARSPEEFAERMMALRDARLNADVAERSAEFAATHFSPDTMAAAIWQTFDKMETEQAG